MSLAKKIAVVLGTRPEIIKMAELCRLLKQNKEFETHIVFTGQHYSYELFQVFMKELEMPELDINLGVKAESNEVQVAEMVEKISEFVKSNGIELVLAQGDTNSVLAAALAAQKQGVMLGHVEAGLRSFDMTMPEERNRIKADEIADMLFAPTKTAIENLENDKAKGKAFLTGNTIVESLQQNLGKAKSSKQLQELGLEPEGYAVLTAHRQENVDKKEKLIGLIEALGQLKVKVVFPMHPRTEKRLKEFELWDKINELENLKIVSSLGYWDFISLSENCMFFLTDSGGIQEEASIYKKPVVILRENTERPEILGTFGKLVGMDKNKIVAESKRIIENYEEIKEKLAKESCPFGDGKASEKIMEILEKELHEKA